MNENPESAPALQPDLNAARKKFSLIGLACLVTFGVELCIDLLLSLAVIPDHPELADYGTVWPWLISMVLMYGITMPAGMFIIKKAGIDGPGSDRKVTGKGFLIFLAVSFAAVYVGSMFSNLINGAIYSASGRSSDLPLPGITNAVSCAMYFLMTVVLGPLMEELFFRKYLLGSLTGYGDRAALLMSALIFSLAHHSVAQMVYAFLGALIFGYVYLRTGRLRYTVVLHSVINLLGGFLPALGTALLKSHAEEYEELNSLLADAQLGAGSVFAGDETLARIMELGYVLMPALLILGASSLILLGMSLAGTVLFIVNRRKIELRPAGAPIGRENVGWTVFMAPGMFAYMVFAIFYLILSFFV